MFLKWIHQSGNSLLSFLSWKSQPQIWDIPLPGVHKSVLNLGHDNARCAEVCPESGVRLCMGGNGLPEIWGMFMHGVQWSARNLGHNNARGAEVCPKSRASLCTVCNDCLKTGTRYCPRCRNVSRICGI